MTLSAMMIETQDIMGIAGKRLTLTGMPPRRPRMEWPAPRRISSTYFRVLRTLRASEDSAQLSFTGMLNCFMTKFDQCGRNSTRTTGQSMLNVGVLVSYYLITGHCCKPSTLQQPPHGGFHPRMRVGRLHMALTSLLHEHYPTASGPSFLFQSSTLFSPSASGRSMRPMTISCCPRRLAVGRLPSSSLQSAA